MNIKNLFLLGVLLFVQFSFSGSQKLEIQGHRGARAILPENTIPAFQYALELGVDVLEMDVVVTSDHILVVNHDLYVDGNRCLVSNGNRIKKNPNIRELTLKQVQEYDCGSLLNSKFPKQRAIPKTKIPALEEVFIWLKNSTHPNAKKVHLNIETKIEEDKPTLSPEPSEFANLLIQLLKKYELLERSTIQSFDFRTLQEAYLLEPELRRVVLVHEQNQNMLEIAQKYKAYAVSPRFTLLKNSKKVQELQKLGFKVIPWTVNEESDWKKMIALGVDGLITDDPEALQKYLNEK